MLTPIFHVLRCPLVLTWSPEAIKKPQTPSGPAAPGLPQAHYALRAQQLQAAPPPPSRTRSPPYRPSKVLVPPSLPSQRPESGVSVSASRNVLRANDFPKRYIPGGLEHIRFKCQHCVGGLQRQLHKPL